MYDLQETCMSRNDLAYITEALGSLIQKAEKQGQHARTVQSSTVAEKNVDAAVCPPTDLLCLFY